MPAPAFTPCHNSALRKIDSATVARHALHQVPMFLYRAAIHLRLAGPSANRSKRSQAKNHKQCSARLWNRCACGEAGNGRTEIFLPTIEVALGDDEVAVSIGTQICCRTKRFSPNHVVGSIDDAVVVKIAFALIAGTGAMIDVSL